MSYSLVRMNGKVVAIRRDSDGSNIPLSDGNKDYIAFSAWNDAQPTPLDFSDEPFTETVPKGNVDLFYAFDALTAGQRDAVLCALAARALQREPSLLIDAVQGFSGFSGLSGVDIVGDEPA